MNNPSYTTEITALSHEGRGIAHIDGKTVFLENALPGESVNFVYKKRHAKFAEGKVTEILRASPERVTPPCPFFSFCGGCSLQHLNSSAQLRHKQNVLLEQLEHFGNVKPEHILSPIQSPTSGYRCKARLSVKYVVKKNRLLIGFHEKNGRYVADINNCLILDPRVGDKIALLRDLIATTSVFASIPQIEIAIGDTVAALIIRHLQKFTDNDLEKIRVFGREQGLQIYLQPGGRDSINCLTQPEQSLTYTLQLPNEQKCELLFHPADFTQINPYINRQLVPRLLELLEPKSSENVLDLFCGLGNFTIPVAKFCATIVGVEGDKEMVERGTENAKRNGVNNAAFYSADLATINEQSHQQTAPWLSQKFDKIILDPPRTGAIEIIKYLPKFKAKKIVYISCNPATLARDAQELCAQGYTLTHAGIADMFPHTSHVESIAVFAV